MLIRLNDVLTKALLVLAALLAFALSFLVVADVLGRDIWLKPVKGTKEMVEISIVIICFLQASHAVRSGSMIRVDVILELCPKALRRLLMVIGYLAGAAFFALIAWGSVDGAIHAWVSNEFEGEGSLRIPVWPARFVIVFSSSLVALQYLIAALSVFEILGLRDEAGEAPHV